MRVGPNISLSSLRQHYLVAMATSLEISKKGVKIDNLLPKTLSFGEKTAKIGLVHPEIFGKIRQTLRKHVALQHISLLYLAAILDFSHKMTSIS